MAEPPVPPPALGAAHHPGQVMLQPITRRLCEVATEPRSKPLSQRLTQAMAVDVTPKDTGKVIKLLMALEATPAEEGASGTAGLAKVTLGRPAVWRHLKRVMRSVPSQEELEGMELTSTLDVRPQHTPSLGPGALRVLVCPKSMFRTLPSDTVQAVLALSHGLVEVQVPDQPPLKKEELFLESKWVWPQNVLASGPPPPPVPNAAETQVMLRCMRQVWAAAMAAHRGGVSTSLCAALIHDPVTDRVMAVDVSAARPVPPRTSTAGVHLAPPDTTASPAIHFAASPGSGAVASAGAHQVRTGGALATADGPVIAASALRSPAVTDGLPALCAKLGLPLQPEEERQATMARGIAPARPPLVTAPLPSRHLPGAPATPILTDDGPVHIGDLLEGGPPPHTAKRQRVDAGGAPLWVSHPDPAHHQRVVGDAFHSGTPLPLSPLHTAVMRVVGQVAAQDKVRHETGHPPYLHRATFPNSEAVTPGIDHVHRDPSPPRDPHADLAASTGAGEEDSPAGEEGEDPVSSRYLCTGFDVYTTVEPEPMDAMALVHARVRRVVYCLPNLAEGALGSRLMLHEQRQLNHHYRVFRVLEAPAGILDMGAPPPPPPALTQ